MLAPVEKGHRSALVCEQRTAWCPRRFSDSPARIPAQFNQSAAERLFVDLHPPGYLGEIQKLTTEPDHTGVPPKGDGPDPRPVRPVGEGATHVDADQRLRELRRDRF